MVGIVAWVGVPQARAKVFLLYRGEVTPLEMHETIAERTTHFFRIDAAIVGMRDLSDRSEGFYS